MTQINSAPVPTTAEVREPSKETLEVMDKVRTAMATITAEMLEAGHVYPSNRGVVSLAELAKRAGIHPTTLHKNPQYKRESFGGGKSFLEQVRAWKDDPTGLGAHPPTESTDGESPGRRRVRELIAAYRIQNSQLRAEQTLACTEAQHFRSLAEDKDKRILELEAEVRELNDLVTKLSAGKVTPLHPGKGPRRPPPPP